MTMLFPHPMVCEDSKQLDAFFPLTKHLAWLADGRPCPPWSEKILVQGISIDKRKVWPKPEVSAGGQTQELPLDLSIDTAVQNVLKYLSYVETRAGELVGKEDPERDFEIGVLLKHWAEVRAVLPPLRPYSLDQRRFDVIIGDSSLFFPIPEVRALREISPKISRLLANYATGIEVRASSLRQAPVEVAGLLNLEAQLRQKAELWTEFSTATAEEQAICYWRVPDELHDTVESLRVLAQVNARRRRKMEKAEDREEVALGLKTTASELRGIGEVLSSFDEAYELALNPKMPD